MTEFRSEEITPEGEHIRPHVTIVMNFTKPTATRPSLLAPYEVETFLHEFGHALHGLFAATKYASLSGTNVLRDFVELPSQFNENYLTEKEFLDGFARHYQTGEPIPAELVDRIVAVSRFGAAYACLRQLNFGLIDMAWHSITSPVDDPEAFECEAGAPVAMFAHIPGSVIGSTFSTSLPADMPQATTAINGPKCSMPTLLQNSRKTVFFDRATAESFRTCILMRGAPKTPINSTAVSEARTLHHSPPCPRRHHRIAPDSEASALSHSFRGGVVYICKNK